LQVIMRNANGTAIEESIVPEPACRWEGRNRGEK
jgi:hypothetical protein